MFRHLDLTFERGTVLTREMLTELRAFPIDVQDIQYHMHPDGILAGTEVGVKDGKAYIKGGLIKYQGRIYRSMDEIDLSEQIEQWKRTGQIGEQSRYKLMFVPKEAERIDGRGTQVAHTLQLEVMEEQEEKAGIRFASFRLNSRNLVALYHEDDMEDITKAIFWNMIECPYACRSGITYHPYIFEALKQKLVAKRKKTGLDYMVLNQISTAGILSMELIQAILEEEEVTKRQQGQTASTHLGDTCWEEMFAAGVSDAGGRAKVFKAFLEVMMQERTIQPAVCEPPARRKPEIKREEGRMLL